MRKEQNKIRFVGKISKIDQSTQISEINKGEHYYQIYRTKIIMEYYCK